MGRDAGADIRALLIGTAAGLALGAAFGRRYGGIREIRLIRELARIEERIVDRFMEDPILSQRPLDVAALTPRVIELTGTVRDEDEADRAVALAQEASGATTVVNRLDVAVEEEHALRTRLRNEAEGLAGTGAGRLTQLGVGTGRRRQGRETEPDRPDDKVRLVTRALGVNRIEEAAGDDVAKLSPAVEGHTTGPAAPTDRGTVEDASHRRLGNVPEEPIQDLNPSAGVLDDMKKGTRLTLEQSGLDLEGGSSAAEAG